MSILFFDHLVVREEITSQVSSPDPEELAELVELIDRTLNHHVLDLILTHLPHAHHQDFLARFHAAPHDVTHIEYLRVHIPDIEEKIKSHAKKIKSDLLSDIRKSKSKK